MSRGSGIHSIPTTPRGRTARRLTGVGAAAWVLLLMACSTAAQPGRSGPSDVVATVGQVTITLSQVDEVALQMPAENYGGLKLSQALYEARRAAIDDLVGNVLLDQEAKSLGIDRAALVDREVTANVRQPTDADVAAWYQANQGRVQGATLDQVRAPIRALLLEDRTGAARAELLDRLKAKTPVKVMLDPPRQSVNAGDSPARGPRDAPVQLIEFSDFQCPFCLRVNPTVTKVLETYGDKIRMVYRFYPLPNHPNAHPAAEAASCADEQGKFWPYHDRLFASPSKLTEADLKQTAADLGLDVAKFDQCFDSHASRARVEADIRAGRDAGVNGTPAFFINGRPVTGAQPFEAFKRVIDEELQTKSR